MRRSSNDEDNKRIIMDLDVVLKSHNCQYIVQCIGTFIFTVEFTFFIITVMMVMRSLVLSQITYTDLVQLTVMLRLFCTCG